MLSLAREFRKLNSEQQMAVKEGGNTVVLAGPGSGKTATLVVKVAYLLSEIIPPPHGLACITYNNDTVREFRSRLVDFGFHPSQRLFLGTVHSFCLNCILRPFAPLLRGAAGTSIEVASEHDADVFLAKVFNEFGRNENPSWFKSTLTKIRRARDCAEDLTQFSEDDVAVVDRYLDVLGGSSKVDFDEMVSKSLRVVQENSWVCQMLSTRFPWLIVDEYQDLGGPLDKIVTSLTTKGHVKVFAVGDPDQTIYDFTGANPKYLAALSRRPDFTEVRLKFNYRSGRKLIDASQAALAPAEPRNYRPDPGRDDEGEVLFYGAEPELESHAALIATEIIPEMQARRVPLDEIAILYRQKGPLVTAIEEQLAEANIPFIAEKDSRYPRTLLIQWLQDCAAFALDESGEILFESLVRYYHNLCYAAGVVDSRPNMELRTRLYDAVVAVIDSEQPLVLWLREVQERIDLRETLSRAPEYVHDLEALTKMMTEVELGGPLQDHTITDFATDAKLAGKVVVTTLHSSKGRQFDAVVLPGLVEGLVPSRRWNRRDRNYPEPTPASLSEDRRLFYVGFTRARKLVALVSAASYVNQYGYPVELGESRFVGEIRTRLGG